MRIILTLKAQITEGQDDQVRAQICRRVPAALRGWVELAGPLRPRKRILLEGSFYRMGQDGAKQKYLSKEVVNNLQGEIKKRGHNAETLGSLLKISPSTLRSNLNGNRRNPKVRQAVADFLGQPPAILFPAAEKQS